MRAPALLGILALSACVDLSAPPSVVLCRQGVCPDAAGGVGTQSDAGVAEASPPADAPEPEPEPSPDATGQDADQPAPSPGADAAADRPEEETGAAADAGPARDTSRPEAPPDAPADGPLPVDTLAAHGAACTAGAQCRSGFCVDRVCCESACAGPCEACDLPGRAGTCAPVPRGQDPADECPTDPVATCQRDGACDGNRACQFHAAGTICAPGGCIAGIESSAGTCDGLGVCRPPVTRSCGSYGCGPSGTCLGSCTRDADCLAPRVCTNGACTLRPNGAPCGGAGECASGSCQQGVCCATPCTGPCRSCALAGSAGTCTSVPAGQDPLDHCADQGAASCGTDGVCNGQGACRLYAAGVECAPATCTAGTESSARTCDGAGACRPATTRSCAPYGCAGNACAAGCAQHQDCAAGFWCNGTTCASLAASLVGHWKLDESAGPSQDSSGNGQHGTWEGTPAGATGVVPAVRFANPASLRCDRADMDRVRIARTPQLEPGGAFTVAVWVRRSGNAGEASWAALFRKSWMNNASPTHGTYALQLPGGDWSRLTFGTGHAGSVDDLLTPPGTVPDGVWVHVAGVYDPAGPAPQKRVYVNGALSASKDLSTPVVFDTTATGDLYVCHPGGGGPEYFNGHLDDLRVYGRALSGGEIQALAAGQ